MITYLYNFSIYLYNIIISLSSPFNKKAKLWIDGRKDIFKKLESEISNKDLDLIWIHCASLGEFEQGRPLIEKIKKGHSQYKILLTFFSPSGYEIRKNYSGADYVFYLPIDTILNSKRFIRIVKPKMAFFVKYEFWFNYLNELKKQNIPLYLVSGIFRKEQLFFKTYGAWFRNQLNCFTHFFVQDEASNKLLSSIGFTNVKTTGDTRFDRVNEVSKNTKPIPFIEEFKEEKKIFIAGSSWDEDEQIIASFNFQKNNFKIIIAPHEINESHINSIINKFKKSIVLRYSEANKLNIIDAQVLIMDNIGMLSSLYQYGTIAYIGGGFGKGIHNILEAATFGLPIIFGPNYKKFTEANELINLNCAFSITSITDFEKKILLLGDDKIFKETSKNSKHYVESRIGATDKTLSVILLK